jgi:hypothetical protein
LGQGCSIENCSFEFFVQNRQTNMCLCVLNY